MEDELKKRKKKKRKKKVKKDDGTEIEIEEEVYDDVIDDDDDEPQTLDDVKDEPLQDTNMDDDRNYEEQINELLNEFHGRTRDLNNINEVYTNETDKDIAKGINDLLENVVDRHKNWLKKLEDASFENIDEMKEINTNWQDKIKKLAKISEINANKLEEERIRDKNKRMNMKDELQDIIAQRDREIELLKKENESNGNSDQLVAELRKDCRDRDNDIDKLKRQIELLKLEVTKYKDAVKDKDAEILKLQEELERLKKERIQDKNEIERLKEELANAIAAKDDEIDDLKAQLKKLQLKQSEAGSANAAELDKLRQQLNDANMENNEEVKKLQDIISGLKSSNAGNAKQGQELERLKAELAGLQDNIKGKDNEIAKLKAELDELRNARANDGNLNNEIIKLKKIIEQKDGEINELKKQVKVLETELMNELLGRVGDLTGLNDIYFHSKISDDNIKKNKVNSLRNDIQKRHNGIENRISKSIKGELISNDKKWRDLIYETSTFNDKCNGDDCEEIKAELKRRTNDIIQTINALQNKDKKTLDDVVKGAEFRCNNAKKNSNNDDSKENDKYVDTIKKLTAMKVIPMGLKMKKGPPPKKVLPKVTQNNIKMNSVETVTWKQPTLPDI